MLCARFVDESPQNSSDSPHAPEHLIVLANGILSDPNDWAYFRSQLLEESGQILLVYAEKDNVYCKTMGGVDVAGKRLARGVLEVVKQTPSLKRISFVGHSLGGLFVRYALAMLYRPARGQSLRTRNGEETNSDQPQKHVEGAGSVRKDTGFTEMDQCGGATWRPSACSAHNTDQAEGTPFAAEASALLPVGAGLDAPERRVIDALAATHNPTEPSFLPTNPNCQPTKPTSQPNQEPISQPSFQLLEPKSQLTEPDLQPIKSTNFQPIEPSCQPSKPTRTQATGPSFQPLEPDSEPTNPSSQPTEPTSQPTNPSSKPSRPNPQPPNPRLQHTNPESQPTEPNSQPTIAGLEPAHLILVAVPNLGVWGRNQWPFARGVHSFERVASCFSGLFLGRTLRQLFLRDRGVAGEPLLMSMAKDCKDRPFVSALGAFQSRHMYANVKWDAALGWKTSCVRFDGDLDRVRKECFGRAKEKQWLGERYPYIAHVEDTPGRGGSSRGGAPEYVFAPPLVRQMSDAVVSALKRKRGGVKKGLESDGLTKSTGDDMERTVESMKRTDDGLGQRENGTERTAEGAERTSVGTKLTSERTERTAEVTERASEGAKRASTGAERTVGRTVRTEDGTERTDNRTERPTDMRTARAKQRTHRWSSEAACRALADRMVTGLHQVSWRKLDVLFYDAPNKKYAHQMLIMKEPRPQAAGQGVVNHMIDVLCGRV